MPTGGKVILDFYRSPRRCEVRHIAFTPVLLIVAFLAHRASGEAEVNMWSDPTMQCVGTAPLSTPEFETIHSTAQLTVYEKARSDPNTLTDYIIVDKTGCRLKISGREATVVGFSSFIDDPDADVRKMELFPAALADVLSEVSIAVDELCGAVTPTTTTDKDLALLRCRSRVYSRLLSKGTISFVWESRDGKGHDVRVVTYDGLLRGYDVTQSDSEVRLSDVVYNRTEK